MIEQLLFIVVLIFSIVVHECAHGVAAERAGDPTARMLGRITLNPIPHIDLIGSIALPAILIISGSAFLFGWAKPVPVNPAYFRDRRRDEIRVSFAGPASNLLLSVVFLFLSITWAVFGGATPDSLFLSVFNIGMLINLVLAFFNLMPIPPLDGSHILENVLPPRFAQFMAQIRPYGFMILILVIMTPIIRIPFLPVKFIYNIYLDILRLFL